MKKESFLEKFNEHFFAIIGVVAMFFCFCLWDVEIMPFEDCLFFCILLGVGSIVNTILVTGDRIIKKINEHYERNDRKNALPNEV